MFLRIEVVFIKHIRSSFYKTLCVGQIISEVAPDQTLLQQSSLLHYLNTS